MDSNVEVSIWIRPTIGYSAKCTGETGIDKFSNIVEGLSSENAGDDSSAAGNTLILGWVGVVFACCCSIPTIYCGLKQRESWTLLGPLCCGFCVPLGMVIGMIVTSGQAETQANG